MMKKTTEQDTVILKTEEEKKCVKCFLLEVKIIA